MTDEEIEKLVERKFQELRAELLGYVAGHLQQMGAQEAARHDQIMDKNRETLEQVQRLGARLGVDGMPVETMN